MALSVLLPAAAGAQSGIQVSPDGQRVLVSKNVGAERWALTRNLSDGSVTGNVFSAGGGAPQFVACSQTGTNGDALSFRCEGADRCHLAPCTRDEWLFIADVDLPASFFEPDGRRTSGGSVQSPGRPGGAVAGAPNQPAGVQIVPNTSASLINKDIGGGERWAITFNFEDDTVTGNVFFPNGDDPAFLWCEKKSFDAGQFVLSCLGADRCDSTCSPEDWTPLAEVPIPEDFFLPPEQVAREEVDLALADSLGAAAAFDALILAVAKGYSVRQIAGAALSGRLLANGDIDNRMGALVAPLEPPYGGASAAVAGVEGASQLIGTDPATVRRRLEETGAEADYLHSSILFMLNRGYTGPQILEAIEAGRIALDARAAFQGVDALLIVDDEGRPVPPAPIGGLEAFLPPGALSFECGNGIVDPGESCEAGVELTQSCFDFGFEGGILSCFAERCRYRTTDCRKCGNTRREPGEECDPTAGPGRGVQWRTCSDLGFDVAKYLRPACTSMCKLDDGPCRDAVETGCRDGRLDPGEDCDGSKYRDGGLCTDIGLGGNAALGCKYLECKYDTTYCVPLPEGCEAGLGAARALRCTGDDCTSVVTQCTPPPTGCGDGVLDDDEQCEGERLQTSSCASFDARYESGTLGCNAASCTYDTSDCGEAPVEPEDRCGDGLLDEDEECEPDRLLVWTCELLGLPPGTLACDQNCNFDTSDCDDPTALCGNGITNPGEQCDGRVLSGVTCESVDDRFVGGSLSCGDDCRYDTGDCQEASSCPEQTCGDGSCVPFGRVCCGQSFSCGAGQVCVLGPGGGCCDEELSQVCGDKCTRPGTPCP